MEQQIEYLICSECGWQGEHDQLVSATDDINDRNFIHCPDCGGVDFETDFEEVDD